MINFDDAVKENIKQNNPNWPQIPNYPYQISIIGGSGSGKTNSLFSIRNQQPNTEKIYLYAKDPYVAKYQFLVHKRKCTILKYFNDSNPNKKQKILIVFDNMIADMVITKKHNPIVTELFIRGRKLSISLAFNTQFLFCCAKRY